MRSGRPSVRAADNILVKNSFKVLIAFLCCTNEIFFNKAGYLPARPGGLIQKGKSAESLTECDDIPKSDRLGSVHMKEQKGSVKHSRWHDVVISNQRDRSGESRGLAEAVRVLGASMMKINGRIQREGWTTLILLALTTAVIRQLMP